MEGWSIDKPSFRELNDSSNFEKGSWRRTRACQLHVSIQSQSLVRAVRSLRIRILRSNWPKCSHFAWKGMRESNAATYAVSWPSWRVIVCRSAIFLFTGEFYFRQRGIFLSAVTGRPEMFRVAVTRWLFHFIPRDMECERDVEREKDR